MNEVDYLTTYRAFVPMKFSKGTRKRAVSFSFEVKLREAASEGKERPASFTLSAMGESSELVVTTNECQWEEAEGMLLLRDCFRTIQNVPWTVFCNFLQFHFLLATRQDVDNPVRWLEFSDFCYFHQTFFKSAATVSQRTFIGWWQWFGAILQRLRFQKHVGSLWKQGHLYGFLSRASAAQCLSLPELPSGTFLVRASQHNPGLFVISYTRWQEGSPVVSHYLIRAEDINAHKHTIADFIHSNSHLKYMMCRLPWADRYVGGDRASRACFLSCSRFVPRSTALELDKLDLTLMLKPELLSHLIVKPEAAVDKTGGYDPFIYGDS